MTDGPVPVENPFVGPRPLQASDRLFARDVELRNLSDLLVAERVVLRYSPSAAGQTSLTFTVAVRGDKRREADEKLLLVVVGGPWLILADPVATGTILNDD